MLWFDASGATYTKKWVCQGCGKRWDLNELVTLYEKNGVKFSSLQRSNGS